MTNREVDGILLVDKPGGMTSHDVVALARRALRTRRVGHTGSLDPFATGLLVMLVGHATRLQPYVEGDPKVYEATIRFGVETDTDDSTGRPVREAPPPLRSRITEAITKLTGTISQTPPAYSAKQVDGVRAYAAARRGTPLVLRAETVVVYEWTILAGRHDELDVRITCGGGTYIRSLARDLGALSGSAAHLSALRRTRSGPFDLANAASVDAVRAGRLALLRPHAAIPGMPTERLSDLEAQRVAHGGSIPARARGTRAALLRGDGALIAIAERDGDDWHPRVVLHGR
jgi:tRNA pseudouridine55 synthase